MSFTLTSTPNKKTSTRESVIYLSPSKRQRTIPPSTSHHTHRSKPSTRDINSWVFRSDAVAPCFIRDVFGLRKNEVDSLEFYWLGAVPCRSVKIVGMVVGVQVYEKRTLYTVDDGTGIIDCTHPIQQSKPPLPKQQADNKYKRVETVSPPVLPPKPIASVGQFVRVTGVVRPQFESRQILVDQIALCSSSNDELFHTRAVRELHRTSYSSTDDFIIPTSAEVLYPQTPMKKVPNTPNSMFSSPPSSVSTSPIKEPVYNSPTKKVPLKQSPIKLRHPSRLHTADLTANTFRLYLKHYMDGAPNDDPIDSIPKTPTKRPHSDETPRPSRYQSYSDATPRHIPRLDFGLDASTSRSSPPAPPPSQATPAPRKGFTLSYLRRVPELALLASRIVDAVSKRRVRDELKKLKASGLPLPHPAPTARLPPDQKRKRVKELFRWAIIKHLREGCIVIWDGPARRCQDIPEGVSRLWKVNASASSVGGNSTLFSSTLGSLPSFLTEDGEDEDEGALSDPDPSEEAYVSLTPKFMADIVEDTIRVLVERKVAARNPYAGATKAEILEMLKNDDRWQHLGVWMVDDALKVLEEESRAWQMGREGKEGKWELTA